MKQVWYESKEQHENISVVYPAIMEKNEKSTFEMRTSYLDEYMRAMKPCFSNIH